MKKFIYKMKMTLQYLKDKEVPAYRKILIFIALAYFIFPTDIVPDFVIGLGLLDDAAVLAFIWNAVKSEIGEYIERKERLNTEKAKIIDFDFINKDREANE
jgi:uncharacterized membrane protein YkvA (DUF1232 family)